MAEAKKTAESSDVKPKAKPAASGKGAMDVKPRATEKVKTPDKPLKPAPTEAVATTMPSTTGTSFGRDQLNRPLITKVVLGIIGIVVLVIVIFGVLIYGFRSMSPLTYAVSSVIPYPAERVNGQFVSYHSYLFEVMANQKAYQSNAKLNNQPTADWNSASGKKLLTQMRQHALTKLEDDVITAQLAGKYKVGVSDKEIDDLLNTFYQKYGGKDTLLRTLSQFYGWNLGSFRDVLRKRLLTQKVQAAVASDKAIDAQTKAKAQSVLAKLKGGADFAATAKQDSQSSDASSGGDLGNVSKGQVEDAVYNAASALQPGSLSDVVKTQYGYQIIKVIDKTDSSIHMAHILISAMSYTDYFAQQEKAAKVKTYVKV